MVRSKEVPKKPKDPLLSPPSKPRGFSLRDDGGGFGGSLPRNRGRAAMSPAPASVPNYMRATNSSGAKAGQRQLAGAPSSSASPARQRRPVRGVTSGKVLFPAPAAAAAAASGMVRPTCSSTLKGTKFPSALDLAPGATDAEGPAAMRVCPYTYCSLNGHTHAPAVPLRSFLATRRRLIKTQQSMKHKGVSAFRKGTCHQSPEEKIVCAGGVAKAAPPLVDEDALGDFFVEVYTGPRVSSGTSCSDMSLDEMDATVRRMEFVVFDRCGADDDNEKGNDLGGCGDGEGRTEERPAVCRDSSSECSDAGISGNLVEELPWMRYQTYECDSLDDDVSEEQGVIHEEIGEAEVLARGLENKDEDGKSGRLGDEREEGADEEQRPGGEQIISDLPSEPGIVAEEEAVDCRVDTMSQQEASTGQETQHHGDDEACSSDVVDKMEIAAEQACIVFTMEAFKEQGDKDEDKSEEKLSDGICESKIPKSEVTQSVEDVIEDSCKEETSADQEDANMDSAGELEITENQKDGQSEVKISETVPDVAHEEDSSEQQATSKAVSEGEVSGSSGIGSPNVETSNQPTNGGFEQDLSTVEAFEQDDGTMDNSFEQLDATIENIVSGTQDAQKALEITTCESDDAPEVPGITQGGSKEFNSVYADAPVQMEQEVAACKLEDSSEESGIPQESSQSDKSAHVYNGAQIEVCVDALADVEPEITECKLEGSSEESGIPQESSQSDNSAHVNNGAEAEPEFTACKSKDPSEEYGIAQEIAHDDDPACLGESAQMQLGNATRDLEESSEESQEISEEIGAQNDSEITTCELADQDYNCADLGGGAQNESELTPSELANASEAPDVKQEAVSDDNTADVNDGPQKESEIIACEPEQAHEEVDIITQEGNEDDYTASALEETQTTTCETKGASEDVCTTEEANLMSIVQTPQHNSDLSAPDAHGEPHNLPAEDNDAKEFSVDDMCNVFSGMKLKGDVYVDPTESEISPRKRLIIAGRRRTPEEEEYMRGFNPRAPNFLPLELDPDSEKVDLKHQTAEDRKNAEEWMIDYALRRAVNNLGPARKKKVELLVQAFETVLPHEEDDKKNITPTRPAQACN